MIAVKRAYDPAAKSDGYRVLVDRLWPRGIRKSDLKLDEWLKEVAPSTELRKWFHTDPDARFDEFERRYRRELDDNPALDQLRGIVSEHKTVTLLYSVKDVEHNHAAILAEILS